MSSERVYYVDLARTTINEAIGKLLSSESYLARAEVQDNLPTLNEREALHREIQRLSRVNQSLASVVWAAVHRPPNIVSN